MTKITVCSALFQLYWFGLVWSAGRAISPVVIVLCVILSVVQLAVLARPFKMSLMYLAAGVFAGVLMDSVLSYTGVHSPVRDFLPWPLAPLWLIGLWVAFVTYTRTGLDGLRGTYVVPAAAGLICGPLAWFGGFKMGACEVNSNLLAGYGVMGICWLILCVGLFKLSDIMQVRYE